ncbi:MAG: FkbM family methyltransferase, partial [Alphaproteobacteria bacterium]|nr:FkbM family methyltransferase [Alphaproteobacteria bacterium]
GILAEPGQCWHATLAANRSCVIDRRCVWSKSGETVRFNQTAIPELSTIDKFSFSDLHKAERKGGARYDVTTVSLMDLLAEHNAPPHIDYLSIDTEGSEFEILENFDFGRYDVQVITCEHNYTPTRKRVHTLLSAKGYVRKFETVSEFDDWYVKGSSLALRRRPPEEQQVENPGGEHPEGAVEQIGGEVPQPAAVHADIHLRHRRGVRQRLQLLQHDTLSRWIQPGFRRGRTACRSGKRRTRRCASPARRDPGSSRYRQSWRA